MQGHGEERGYAVGSPGEGVSSGASNSLRVLPGRRGNGMDFEAPWDLMWVGKSGNPGRRTRLWNTRDYRHECGRGLCEGQRESDGGWRKGMNVDFLDRDWCISSNQSNSGFWFANGEWKPCGGKVELPCAGRICVGFEHLTSFHLCYPSPDIYGLWSKVWAV